MDDIPTAIEGVKAGLALFSEAIGLAKQTKELLPESQDKEAIEQGLEQANKAAKLAESQVAQALGYKLCQCTFPPHIMLSHGYKELEYHHEEEFVCPNCKKSSIEPPSKPINYEGWRGSP